jgi:EmrB/QacA subfamily drug resistance transporter
MQLKSNPLLWLVAAGFFMQTLDSTIVTTALPAMARSLGQSALAMQSVVVSYSLSMAILIPASGWLADRFGTRKIYLCALFLFAVGSLVCALAPDLRLLVAGRIVQGVGGAMLLPVGRLAVLRHVPRKDFLAAMSLVTVPGMMGPLIGPALGGWLVVVASWHWIFLINLPIAAIGMAFTLKAMPDFRQDDVPSFDGPGFALLAASMALISLGLDGLAGLGLGHAAVLLLVMFGLICLAAYWLRASRHPAPLFPLTLFTVVSYRVGLIGNLFSRIGIGSMPFLIALLLQVMLGYSPLDAGLMMIPVALAGLLTKRVGMRLIGHFGYRRLLIVNTLVVGAVIASFATFSVQQPLWLQVLQLSLLGVANSLQFAAMNTLTLNDLEPHQTSSGNGLLSMVMMLSMSLGVAAAGGTLAAFAGVLGSQAGAQSLSAFHATFACMGAITAVSSFVFWQLPPDQPRRDKRGDVPADAEVG